MQHPSNAKEKQEALEALEKCFDIKALVGGIHFSSNTVNQIAREHGPKAVSIRYSMHDNNDPIRLMETRIQRAHGQPQSDDVTDVLVDHVNNVVTMHWSGNNVIIMPGHMPDILTIIHHNRFQMVQWGDKVKFNNTLPTGKD
jgi:hypothetical protein